jgi:hypothetical protein
VAKDPVARYIDDAMAVAKTDGFPPQAARRVVPALCRMAIDAACMESVRRRRLARGERHEMVEDLLADAKGTRALAALALFDDPDRVGDVSTRLKREAPEAAETFRLLNEGAHEGLSGAAVDVIRSAEKLAGWLQRLQ